MKLGLDGASGVYLSLPQSFKRFIDKRARAIQIIIQAAETLPNRSVAFEVELSAEIFYIALTPKLFIA